MSFLNSDVAKVVGAVLAAVAGVLVVQYPPPNTIGTIASIATAVLAGLGLISGGVKVAQPKPPPPPA